MPDEYNMIDHEREKAEEIEIFLEENVQFENWGLHPSLAQFRLWFKAKISKTLVARWGDSNFEELFPTDYFIADEEDFEEWSQDVENIPDLLLFAVKTAMAAAEQLKTIRKDLISLKISVENILGESQ